MMTEDVVHLHLEQRVVQRLLGPLPRAGVRPPRPVPRLPGAVPTPSRASSCSAGSRCTAAAARLHEELMPVAARWIEPDRRDGPLKAYARDAEAQEPRRSSMRRSLNPAAPPAAQIAATAARAASRDVEDLLPQLEARALELADGPRSSGCTSEASASAATTRDARAPARPCA